MKKNMDVIQIYQLHDSELEDLIAAGKDVCISMVMPVQQEVDKRDENRIRLKNLIQEAEQDLAALDHRRPAIEKLLQPAEELVLGGRFLNISGPGLAIYLAKDFSRAYQLPHTPERVASVGPYFHVKPLLPLRSQEQYYVLSLSQQSVRLLRATPHTIERVDLAEIPQSLDEALRWDDPEKELQWHSKTGNENDGRFAVFHGHGVSTKEITKENLLRYFQLLDKGVSDRLTGTEAPLLLAGVDYLLPIYREASSYENLSDEVLVGSHDHLSDAEIQQLSWELVRPLLQDKQREDISRYHKLAAQSLASGDLTAVIEAAYQGRIATLFVALDEQRWGQFDATTGRATLHDHHQPGDVDLLNLAAIFTLRNGGKIYAIPRQDIPDDESLAAILRF